MPALRWPAEGRKATARQHKASVHIQGVPTRSRCRVEAIAISSTGTMTIEDGTDIVLAYVLGSMGVIIAFLLAAFAIGWLTSRLRARVGWATRDAV